MTGWEPAGTVPGGAEAGDEILIASLYQEIGHVKMQVDWLEKSKAFPLSRDGLRSKRRHKVH